MADGGSLNNFLYKTMIERDPNKRRVKPIDHDLMDFGFGMEDSSDDSDFNIDEQKEESDDNSNIDSSNEDSDDESSSEDDDDDEDEEMNSSPEEITVEEAMQRLQKRKEKSLDEPKGPGLKGKRPTLICSICLGDLSLDIDEVVECDGCGASVHEACYGIADTGSIASTVSSASTEPWFCEACRAGVKDPDCELCPNKGGIFKETDVGSWVHLVCALYVPGVAFGEVDKLSAVTLFEMNYSMWSMKECCLCEDDRFARTGVCISCDAGLCKTFFHVSCAQREGLLHDGHHDTNDQSDPFYAHCKLHSDKAKMRTKKRNWMAMHSNMKRRSMELTAKSELSGPIDRITRKLNRQQEKYKKLKIGHPSPWVPTQKMPRMLTSSPAACRALLRKAELMELDTKMLETVQAQQQAVLDARKKWHIPSAFSVEFVSYYLDRNVRIKDMNTKLSALIRDEKTLRQQEEKERELMNALTKENDEEMQKHDELIAEASKFHELLCGLSGDPNYPMPKKLHIPPPSIVRGNQSSLYKAAQQVKASAASAHNQGTLSPLPEPKPDVINPCSVCESTEDQHQLVKCDTCRKHYHLACLNPPLSRMPKKTKLYGWECSDCNPGSSSSDDEKSVDITIPRLTRRDTGPIRDYHLMHTNADISKPSFHDQANDDVPRKRKKPKKKKKREDKKVNSIKIKIKPIVDAQETAASPSGSIPAETSSMSVVIDSDSRDDGTLQSFPSPTSSVSKERVRKPKRPSDVRSHCDTCNTEGNNSNLVRCDRCFRCFHYGCLVPPSKTNPKPRGFSWYCQECDSSEDEETPEQKNEAALLNKLNLSY